MTNIDRSQPVTDRLALLYRLAQTFNSTLDLDEVLNRVMDEVIAVTRAERGFVMLHEAGGELVFRVARGMDQSTIEAPQFQISRGVVESVAYEGQPVLASNAQRDDRFNMRLSVVEQGLRSILCVPLKVQDRVAGVVYVDNRLRAGLFTQDDLDLLSAIASSAAIAIENARLYQLAVEKGRLDRELQLAREVQASLLPHQIPEVSGWEFAATWLPARQVSGDYYDFVPGDGGQLGLVIADVSGKGMPAALFMALTRSVVRASTSHAPSVADAVAHANRLICADSSDGMFVTLFFGLLDAVAGDFTYVNAGHNPPLLCHASGSEADSPVELRPTGTALGLGEDFPFEQRTVHLDPGDLLMLYTDGVPDAIGAGPGRFGMERLCQVIQEQRQASAAGLLEALEDAIREFTGSAPQFDDIAVVIAKRR
jgi:phosphoserine phosphatase RsbU/P